MLLRITDGTTTYYTLSGDGSTILGCTYAPTNGGVAETVAETGTVVLEGSESAIRAVEDGVESILGIVRQREQMFAPYFYVEYRPSGSGTVYRSKLVDGKVLRDENPARRRVESSTNAVELTVVWERENFWEETTESEIYLSSNTQTERTGGVTVYNNDNATSSQNWAQAAANRVTGQVEAPIRLRLANASGADRDFSEFYFCNNVWSDPANLNPFLLGASAVGGATVSWTGSIAHTTDAYIWNLSNTVLTKTQGRYFRILVAFTAMAGVGINVQASVGNWDGVFFTEIENSGEIYAGSGKTLLLMTRPLPIAPGGYNLTSDWAALKLSFRSSASGSAGVDFVQMMPADNFRFIRQNGYATANGESVEDDGILGGTYHYNASGRKVALMTPYGQPIKVWPGRVNRLHFLEYETSFVAGRQMTMQAWYRPRWRVV